MEKTQQENLLFQKCANGSRLKVEAESILLEPEKMICLSHGKDGMAVIPSDGRWMQISFRAFRAAFGMAGLADYTLEEMNREVFHLGIYGTLRFRLAHISGIRPLLLSRDQAAPDEIMVLLQPDLKPVISEALWEILDKKQQDYRKIRDEVLPGLGRKLEHAFFSGLFERGLCLQTDSLHIENISRPVIRRTA